MGAIAALLVVGGLAVGFAIMQPGTDSSSQALPPNGDAAATPNTDSTVEVPGIEAHRDNVRAKIREQMQRRQEEIQAGMDEEETDGIGVEGEVDPLEEAMRKARRVPVRPDEQTPIAGQVDSKGFRKPIARQIANSTRNTAAPTSSAKGSAQVTEHKTRDPGRLYYDNGRRAMERKNYGSALKMFQTSVDKSPQCGSCWEGLASAYQVLGEAQKAAEAFKKAEELGVPVNAARP
jgi:tetratricopeptide (TPR) repeat protein